MKILAVDDHADTTSTHVQLLKALGFDAHGGTDGSKVLELLEQLRPDVLLLDLMMPIVSGYDVARQLKKRPELRPRCVIAVSGMSHTDDAERAKAAGFDYFLLKPIILAELLAALADGFQVDSA